MAPKKYVSSSLHGIVEATDETTARAWAGTLQELVDALRALGRSADIEDALETAIRVGRDSGAVDGLERVRKSLGKLRATAVPEAPMRVSISNAREHVIAPRVSRVYFIQTADGGPIKIGVTGGDPNTRLKDLQTANPQRLELIGTLAGDVQVERQLHRRFEKLRLQGEWFRPEPELLAFVQALEAA